MTVNEIENKCHNNCPKPKHQTEKIKIRFNNDSNAEYIDQRA